jgi:hypothetical protein
MRKAHWKNIGLSVAIACVMSLGLMSAGTVFAGAKVDVCHLPPGNPENFHTITISENALSAHLGHGDFEGACNANCASLCDDGNACTIDDTGDCAEVGCPLAPEPVDCNDSDPTTVDTCDPSVGCINTPTVVCPCDFSADNFTANGGDPCLAILTVSSTTTATLHNPLAVVFEANGFGIPHSCSIEGSQGSIRHEGLDTPELEACVNDIKAAAAALENECN